MKNCLILFIAVLTLTTAYSCHTAGKSSFEPKLNTLTWKPVFHKNDFQKFKRTAFSSNGERFLISDNYWSLSLWEKPFVSPMKELSPVHDLPIESYGDIIAMQFFGNQDDIFLATSKGLVQIWDKSFKYKIFEYDKFNWSDHYAAITQDGRFISIGGELYDRQKRNKVGQQCKHITQYALNFGHKSLLLSADYQNRRICVRNLISGNLEYRYAPHPISGAGISPNEKYAVAITDEGRGYLWNWPDQKPKAFGIAREDSWFEGFSPDSKWFVIRGVDEFVQIFQTNPLEQIARLQSDPAYTTLDIASNNLIVLGDHNGYVHIYDVSSGRMIAQQKVCKHEIGHLKLFVETGYLWVATNSYNYINEGKCEIALFHIKGLGPYIEPEDIAKRY